MDRILKANGRVLVVKRTNGQWYQPRALFAVRDPATTLFTTAAGITDDGQAATVNTLIVSLKSTGLWNKLLAIYPMIGGTEQAHKFNLKDARDADDAYRLTFMNNPVHNDVGVNWNDTSYAKTHLTVPSIANASIGYYTTRTSTTSNDVCIGTALNGNDFYLQQSNGTINGVYGTGDHYIVRPRFTSGLLAGTSYQGTSSMYYNGILVGNSPTYSSAPAPDIYLNGYHTVEGNVPINMTNAPCSFAFIGSGLSNNENLTLYIIIQVFQTSLSRVIYTPPLAFAGVVTALATELPVSVLYNDPHINKVGSWNLLSNPSGVIYPINTTQDGSVYLTVDIFAVAPTTADFYFWKDSGDYAGTFDVQVDGVTVVAPVSVYNAVNDYSNFKMATTSIAPGLHQIKIRLVQNIRPDVTAGHSFYFHSLELSAIV